jgi:hypothetical protein
MGRGLHRAARAAYGRRSLRRSLLIAFAVLGVAAPAHASRSVSLVSVPTGVAESGQGNFFAAASHDQSHVFFSSKQPMAPGDGESTFSDIYERFGGLTSLMSAPTGVADPATADAGPPVVSSDGLRVFFATQEKLTPEDTDSGRYDVYERFNGFTTLVTGPTGVADPDTEGIAGFTPSPDGLRVAFSTTQRMTTDDTDSNRRDTYLREGGVTKLLTGAVGIADPDSADASATVSADGAVSLITTAQKLTADDVDSNRIDVYRRNAGATTLLTKATDVLDPNTGPVTLRASSPDLEHLVFETEQTMTGQDGDGGVVDLYELADGHLRLITGEEGIASADIDNFRPVALAPDGSRLVYATRQQMLPEDDDGDLPDLYEWSGGHQHLISVAEPGATGPQQLVESSLGPAATADARHVFFETAQRMTPGDTDDQVDLYERFDGHTTLLSVPAGVPEVAGNVPYLSGISDDGRRVFFRSNMPYTTDDTDSGRWDVYERAYGVTRLISVPDEGPAPNAGDVDSQASNVSGNLSMVLQTDEPLAAGDGDAQQDVFVARLKAPLASTEAPAATTLHGSVTPFGTPTNAYFEYGTSTGYGARTPDHDAGTGEGPTSVEAVPAGLAPGTTYHARLVAESEAGRAEGSDVTFTTPAALDPALDPAPVISGLRLSRSRFHRGGRRATLARAKVGTVIRFRLSEDAKVTLRFARKVGRRYRAVKGKVVVQAKRGVNRIRFQGRLAGKRRLRLGGHRVTLVAVDAAGQRSKVVRASFRIVR